MSRSRVVITFAALGAIATAAAFVTLSRGANPAAAVTLSAATTTRSATAPTARPHRPSSTIATVDHGVDSTIERPPREAMSTQPSISSSYR